MLDGVTIWGGEGTELEDVDHADLRRLSVDLHHAVKAKLSEDYEMVDEAGPGTLRISIALTDAGKSNAALDVFSTIVPQARILSAGKSMATGHARAIFLETKCHHSRRARVCCVRDNGLGYARRRIRLPSKGTERSDEEC